MPASPLERQEFGRRLRAIRGKRTLQAMADALRDEHGFRTNSSQLSGWERGEYAPRHRSVVSELDDALGAGGALLGALGHLTDRDADFGAIGGKEHWTSLEPADVAQHLALLNVRVLAIEEALGINGTEVVQQARLESESNQKRRALRLAAEGGPTESQKGTVTKPPATSGFDPDET